MIAAYMIQVPLLTYMGLHLWNLGAKRRAIALIIIAATYSLVGVGETTNVVALQDHVFLPLAALQIVAAVYVINRSRTHT